VFWIAFCILIINRHLFRYVVDIEAISPTLKFKDYFHINHIIPSFKTKIYSHSSFPGDHATTAFLFYFLTKPLFQENHQKLRRALLIIALLPRLVVGAHNISDVVVGSSILSFGIFLMFHKTGFFEKLSRWVSKKNRITAS
jgi:membrane-associated phospholipid phosphatase